MQICDDEPWHEPLFNSDGSFQLGLRDFFFATYNSFRLIVWLERVRGREIKRSFSWETLLRKGNRKSVYLSNIYFPFSPKWEGVFIGDGDSMSPDNVEASWYFLSSNVV